jgi:hypothetical protein
MMIAAYTVTIEPLPGGGSRRVQFPATPGPEPGTGGTSASVVRWVIEREREETRRSILEFCEASYGPGELTGSIEEGFRFNPAGTSR